MIDLISIVGILGGFCFAYCGVPAAWTAWKLKRNPGIPISTAWMITLGGILMYTYLTVKNGFDWILLINYTIETLSWGLIVWLTYFPKNLPESE